MNPDDIQDMLDSYIVPDGISDLHHSVSSKMLKNSYYGAMGGGVGIHQDTIRGLGTGIKGIETQMVSNASCKKLIKEKKIRIPYDMKFNDILLISKAEPDFLDNLKEEYPEYFI